jgi:hypothetical protein
MGISLTGYTVIIVDASPTTLLVSLPGSRLPTNDTTDERYNLTHCTNDTWKTVTTVLGIDRRNCLGSSQDANKQSLEYKTVIGKKATAKFDYATAINGGRSLRDVN